MARLKDWAQLVRVPNTLTASADALAGFSLAAGAWTPNHAPALIVISIASIALYWAGMVLNDVNDIEKDRREQRNGPLVDGRIAWERASRFGWGLIVGGILLALLAGVLATQSRPPLVAFGSLDGSNPAVNLTKPAAESLSTEGLTVSGIQGQAGPLPNLGASLSDVTVADTQNLWYAPALVAVILALCIIAYDSRLKSTPLAAWLMGLCRATNLCMGMALGIAASNNFEEASLRMGNAMILIPIGHGLFVAGLTLAARKESMLKQSGWHLIRGWGVSLMGVALIAMSAIQAGPLAYQYLTPDQGFPMLIALLALPWLNRAVHSVHFKTVPTLVRAIKQAIITILFLDSAIALQFAGATPGIIVCSLIVPTILLGRWFRMT